MKAIPARIRSYLAARISIAGDLPRALPWNAVAFHQLRDNLRNRIFFYIYTVWQLFSLYLDERTAAGSHLPVHEAVQRRAARASRMFIRRNRLDVKIR